MNKTGQYLIYALLLILVVWLWLSGSLSDGVHFALRSGVPEKTMILILALPIIVTLVSFSRQLIGFRVFGIYLPSILTIVFLDIGIKYGLIIFVIVIFLGTAVRYLLHRYRLLYLPRMAITLTVISLGMVGFLVAAGHFDFTYLAQATVFSMMLMIILAEKFIEAEIEKGLLETIKLTLETLLISVGATILVRWSILQSSLLLHPEIILLAIIFNLSVGRWVGLRLREYIRFNDVIKAGEKNKK
jgi:hypothetical protein